MQDEIMAPTAARRMTFVDANVVLDVATNDAK